MTPAEIDETAAEFLRERHLASLTIVETDGRPHVTPVGFTWDEVSGLVRIITRATSHKARLLERTPGLVAAVCQVDGARWLTLEGRAVVSADPRRCATGVEMYTRRYRSPAELGPDRRVIEINVSRWMGRV